MVISFEGNKLEYGENNVLNEYIKLESCQYHDIDSGDSRKLYRENDTIAKAFFGDDGDIIIHMKSGDVFVLLEPFDKNKCRIIKVISYIPYFEDKEE